MKAHVFPKAFLAVCIAAALGATAAYGQSAPAETGPGTASAGAAPAAAQATQSGSQHPAAATTSGDAHHGKQSMQTLQQIVVTGNAGTARVTQLTASYAITTIGEQKLHDLDPHNTASILKSVPGVWVEASGGSDGNNVFVRGLPDGSDSPFVTMEVDGSPLYALPNVGWTSTLDFFRLDDSVERVEVLRGGPSTLFGTGNPGAVFNVITKDGTETPNGAGSVQVSIGGPQQYERVDAFWGGKIAPQWYATIGGFGRRGDAVHDSQYPANDGGQWEGSLTRTFGSHGKLTFGVRHTRDKGLFLADSPVIVSDGQAHPFPGFDLRNDVLNGNDMRMTYLLGNSPGQNPADLADGRGINLTVYRMDFNYDFGNGWFVRNNANYVTGSIPIVGLFNSSTPPMTVSDFIGSSISSANADPALVAAAGGVATSGTATFTHGGGTVDPNQNVVLENFLTNFERVRSFSDELQGSKEFSFGNTLTAGVYLATFGYNQDENSGNNMLMTLQNNAQLVNVALDNGVMVSSPNGFTSQLAGTQNVSAWSGRTIAGYLSDVQVLGPWTIQAGIRKQYQRVSGYTEATTGANVDLDNNVLTLYNNDARVLLPDAPWTYTSYSFNKPAWTVGVNRTLGHNMSVYARASNGYAFPGFGTITLAQSGQQLVNSVRQYTLGFKAEGSIYSVLVDAFYNKVQNSAFTGEFEPSPGIFETVTLSGTTKARGIEFSGTLSPVRNLSLELDATYLHAKYADYGDNSGNRILRQPVLQWRFMPSYMWPTAWGAIRAFASYQRVGQRYAEITNTQSLPPYHEVDAGVQAMVGPRWSFRLTGHNLTNEIGLTEGNGRSLTSGSEGVVYGRSIFGRYWMLSAKYRFGE